jgi:hypothetical protein
MDGHAAQMGFLVGQHEERRPLEDPGIKLEDNIKMSLQEVEWGGMDWIDLARVGTGTCKHSNEIAGSTLCRIFLD